MGTATSTTTTTTEPPGSFDDLVGSVKRRLAGLLEQHTHLFTTDAEGLYDRFLAALPEARQQQYRCGTCREFVTRHGGLVVIDESGRAVPALWGEPEDGAFVDELAAGIRAMAGVVAKARVTGVFLSGHEILGKPEAGGWQHFAADLSGRTAPIHRGLLTAGQAMAAKREEHDMLERGLEEFPLDVVRQACSLLSKGALFRSEKHIGVAKWLLELHTARKAHRKQWARDGLTWRAVASAPAGFCHVRSGMIGTLLEDVAAGLPLAEIKRRFDEKMHPLQYMRPSAAPSAGQIAEAEKIVAELKAAGALRRRFARVEEVEALWRPAATNDDAKPAGVFGHLLPKAERRAAIELPTVTLTWEKLARTVLPEAVKLEFFAPTTHTSYVALVTAADPDAPPIIKWDRPERRNPVTWYVYVNGSPAADWDLEPGRWHEVTAVTHAPSMWYGAPLLNEGRGVVLILRGCRDLKKVRDPAAGGGAFFPEHLRSELHGIRRTMEAYAQSAVIEGAAEATACGLVLREGASFGGAKLRVTDRAGQVATYVLDRWD